MICTDPPEIRAITQNKYTYPCLTNKHEDFMKL